MIIRDVCTNDCNAIVDIYNYYVTQTTITFEEQAVTPGQMSQRVFQVQEAGLVWRVGEIEGVVRGYAYTIPFRTRAAYRHTVESTIYLDQAYVGRGLGQQLYRDLLTQLRKKNISQVIAVLALPNEPSVRLHERLGFQPAGLLKQVGFKFGQWIDTGYWQLNLRPG